MEEDEADLAEAVEAVAAVAFRVDVAAAAAEPVVVSAVELVAVRFFQPTEY